MRIQFKCSPERVRPEFQEMDPLNPYAGGHVEETESDPSRAQFMAAAAVVQVMDQFDSWNEWRVFHRAKAGHSAAANQTSFKLSTIDCSQDASLLLNNEGNFLDFRGNSHLGHTAGVETMASSQPVSGHPSGLEHNYELSREESGPMWQQDVRDRDGIQSSSAGESNPWVPKLGMEFDSEKAVLDILEEYRKQTGFKMVKGNMLKSKSKSKSKVLTGKWFFCSKHKSKKRCDKPIEACQARIKCAVEGEKWKISEVRLKHNHGPEGCLAGTQEEAEDSPARRTLSTGKNVDELRNDVSRGTGKNHSMPQDLIEHFNAMHMEDFPFIYRVQGELGMRNFFWRDGRSLVDYSYFGDVLVLDTRTRIDCHNLICAAFWGFNNHRQRIIFGWAFLFDLTVDSIEWLLRNFLQAMRGQEPLTIITEISEEIAEASRVVLPRTSHCLSPWSILKSDKIGVDSVFSECIFEVQSQEEFESKWKALIAKYKLHGDAAVASLYEMRQKWSHAFTKKVFSAGLLSIQDNNDARDLFKNLPWETMTLCEIACECQEVARQMRNEEFQADHCYKKNVLRSDSMAENQAERFYTKPIFMMFQKEFFNILSLAEDEGARTRTENRYKFKLIKNSTLNIVEFDSEALTLACSCGMFESVNILCSHSLKALNIMNKLEIPSHYLMERWKKSVKDTSPSPRTAHDSGGADSFMGKVMNKALYLVHRCETPKRQRIALTSLDQALDKIANSSKTEEMEVHSEGINDRGPD